MKRIGNLWHEFCSWPNLVLAARKARKRKRQRLNVQRFEFDREFCLASLQRRLEQGNWTPGRYTTFEIRDPKPRLVSAASYTDRVVHHALCNIVEPHFERRFIFDSYACRKGKGTLAALLRAHQFCRRFPWVLKLDIQKYFPSIDHQILFDEIQRSFKDPRLLALFELIIRKHDAPQSPPHWFHGDDLLTPGERPRGLPIGNQTSQLFGNVMLDPFDHSVKESLRVPGYVRYADDMLVFGHTAAELHRYREWIQRFLAGLRLVVNSRKCQVFPCRNGVPFLGARLFPDRLRMSRRLIRRFRGRARTLRRQFQQGRISLAEVQSRIVSWLGHVRHLAPDSFLQDLLKSLAFSRF